MFTKFMDWVNSFTPFISIIILVAALVLWHFIRRLFAKYREKSSSQSQITFLGALQGVLKYALVLITVLVILQVNHVNVGSLLAGVGLVGIILGLALQETLKDVFMGFHILNDSFFAVGDVVLIDGQEGEVISFSLRTTKLRLLADGSTCVLCNRNIERVTVASHQVNVLVPLSYHDDVDRIRALMTSLAEAVQTMDGIEQCAFVGTEDFGSSSIAYKLRFWCDPTQKDQLRRDVLGTVQDELKKAGISIPFDQLDVHLDR